MGDVVSTHLDEAKREIITERTAEVMAEVGRLYQQQYAVALFNKVRYDIEGGGGPQPQLLHRKIPVENKCIFSGSIFQFQEDNKKWRNRFVLVPDSYEIQVYDTKSSHDKQAQAKGSITCAGYKVLTSMEQYLELFSNSLPGVKAKVGSSPFLKCPSQFPLLLWHPFCKHHYFCVTTEKEQHKWQAVLQDCVRHANDGLSEENRVQTPAFTDAVRLYRQAKGQYGTWDLMCGPPVQILSNLVMEVLHPELRDLISPRLKGKLHDRQRHWILISDAVYSLVQIQCQAQYQALLHSCEAAHPALEASVRTNVDQIITSKEYVSNKIRGVVLPKAEKLLKVSIEPYIASILEALMEPTSRGFSEVRELFFKEMVDMSKNTLNNGTRDTVAQHMEKISMLAFHPVKMQSCYEKVENLSLDGLQQRFDVSSPSVFVQRAQILMREQMDDAVYTFEKILHQSLESQGSDELYKIIQRCQDRVIKKFDYDSSTVRKRFFREALLQIFIPYMLKQLSPSCASELPQFQELIFEDFSRFILVENLFEEVVLHSVMKDIMMAVKEAAVQRRHNLYRDSIVLSNSDPSLHLLGENPSIDWAEEYGAEAKEETKSDATDGNSHRTRRMKQVVSMIQVEGSPIIPDSCLEVPGVEDIPEEEEGEVAKQQDEKVEDEAAKEEPSDAQLVENSVKPVKPDDEKAEQEVTEDSPVAGEETATEPTQELSLTAEVQATEPTPEVPLMAEVQATEPTPEVPLMAEVQATEPTSEVPLMAEVQATEPTSEVPLMAEVQATVPTPEVPLTAEIQATEPTPEVPLMAEVQATEPTPEVPLMAEVQATEPTSEVPLMAEVQATEPTSEVPLMAEVQATVPTPEVPLTAEIQATVPSREVPLIAQNAEEPKSTQEVFAEDPMSSEPTLEPKMTKNSKIKDDVEAVVANDVEISPAKSDQGAQSTNVEESTEEPLPPPPPEDGAPDAATQNGDSAERSAEFPLPPHDDSGFQSPTSDDEVANSQLKTAVQASDKEAPQDNSEIKDQS